VASQHPAVAQGAVLDPSDVGCRYFQNAFKGAIFLLNRGTRAKFGSKERRMVFVLFWVTTTLLSSANAKTGSIS
jgi:hypothetical protein